MPPRVKHSCFMFSSALNLVFTSSRYLGIPPVTDRTFNFSKLEIFFGQNLAQSINGNSSSVNVNETRPTKPVLFKRFFSIHDEAELQSTKINRSFFLSRSSQKIFILPRNVAVLLPIHETSSKNSNIFPD